MISRSISPYAGVVLLALISTVLADGPRGIPHAVVPEPFGVNIHFIVPDEAEVDALAAVGYRIIRMDFAWGGIERKKGEYDFSGYDKLVESMSRRGIRCLFILDYGNRLYDNGQAPHSDEARAAFAKWAAAAATRYAGKGILWEIWNEPNLAQFWKPTPNADDYCKLSLAVIDAIRQADPDAFIIGPASSGFPWTFFETMAQRGVLAKLDAVSVHPYRQNNPETAEADYHRLRLLLDRAVPDRHLPILSGEWGYSTGWGGMTEQKQAQYIVRQWLTNMASDVGLSIWYDWKDDGADPKEPEHHFGSVYRDLKPKPASQAAQTLAQTLRGYRFVRRIVTDSPKDHLLLFASGEKAALAAWTEADPHAIQIALPPGDVRIVELTGGERAAKSDEKGLALEIRPSAQYLLPGMDSQAALRLAGWRPLAAVKTVRAGTDSSILIARQGNQPAGQFRVEVAGKVIGKVDAPAIAAATGEQTLAIPVRIDRYDQQTLQADIYCISSDGQRPLQSARVTLLVANNLHASMLPVIDGAVTILVDNPSGEALKATCEATAGDARARADLLFASGVKQATVALQLPKDTDPKAIRAQVINPAGTTLLQIAPAAWRMLPVAADQSTWRISVEGDAKVEASAKATITDTPPALPQMGLPKAVRIDYRFAPGWRYAVVFPPAAMAPIEGKPSTLGMWVFGDGSSNTLRCRFKDSSGQMFQATLGQIDWTGWKWVTMPIDGRDAHHWGGAKDGVVHYPIHLDAPLLIDSAHLKVNQDLRIHATGFSLK